MAETQEPIAAEPEVVVDEYNDGNADSAYDSEVASYTTSLATSVTAYKFENGRRYHAYKEGSYVLPNDEKESDRLDICHKMFEVAMSGKLHFSPISNPKRILDIGTGTGIWAIEMGDIHPQADILGNDLSPIQPRWVPPNVRFEVDDVEAPWTYSQKFDFIFCRTMANTIKDWPRLLQQCLENTKPGGYCEFIDFDIKWTSLDGTLEDESPIWKISREFIKLCAEGGMEASLGPHLESLVKDAGFANVVATRVPLPVGTWPADKRLKEVGAWNYLQVTEGLEGFITYLFVRQGWTKEEVDILCAKARQQIKNPKVHCLFYLHIVYGQAPEKKGKGVDDE